MASVCCGLMSGVCVCVYVCVYTCRLHSGNARPLPRTLTTCTHTVCGCILWQGTEGTPDCTRQKQSGCNGFCISCYDAQGGVRLKGKKRKTEKRKKPKKPSKRETEISRCTTVEDLWCIWDTASQRARHLTPSQRVAFITQLNTFSGSQIKPSSSAHEVNVARGLLLRKSQQQ